MPILSQPDKDLLKEKFENELKDRVNITLFTQAPSKLFVPGRKECQYCQPTEELLRELSSLSDKIQLNVIDVLQESGKAVEYGIDRIPAIILGTDGAANIRYYGIPAGNEFPNLIDGIIHLSQGTSPLSDEARKLVRQIDEEVGITVFVTPT